MSSNLNIQNILDHCRVCLTELKNSQHLDVRLDFDASLTFNEVFKLLTQTDLLADGLPHFICQECGVELQLSYELYKRVQESTKILLQLREQQTEKLQLTALNLASSQEDAEQPAIDEIEEFESITQEDFELESLEEEHIEFEDSETVQIKADAKLESEELSVEDNFDEDAKIKCFNFQIIDETDDFTVLPFEYDESESAHCDETSTTLNVEIKSQIEQNGDANPTEDIVECLEMPLLLSQKRKRHVGKYSCDFCNKIFPNYSRMATHRRLHTGDRPKFVCGYCGREYATKQAKQVHIATAHTKTGYVCNICGKVYPILKSLEIHMRFHNNDFPYVCDICDRKFAQKCHLITHKKVKHNNARFFCDYPKCGKLFTSSASLRNHSFVHTSMPFECNICQKGYPAKAKLKVHMRKKHGLELTLEELEPMRRFLVARSKATLVKISPEKSS